MPQLIDPQVQQNKIAVDTSWFKVFFMWWAYIVSVVIYIFNAVWGYPESTTWYALDSWRQVWGVCIDIVSFISIQYTLRLAVANEDDFARKRTWLIWSLFSNVNGNYVFYFAGIPRMLTPLLLKVWLIPLVLIPSGHSSVEGRTMKQVL